MGIIRNSDGSSYKIVCIEGMQYALQAMNEVLSNKHYVIYFGQEISTCFWSQTCSCIEGITVIYCMLRHC